GRAADRTLSVRPAVLLPWGRRRRRQVLTSRHPLLEQDVCMQHPSRSGSRSGPRFGVNYTPTHGWFHHWLDFDLDEARADLDSVAAFGLDHIRVFPLWPLFQPNR